MIHRIPDLHAQALVIAKEMLQIDDPAAQWIAKNAIRELEKPGLTLLGYPRGRYQRMKLV